MSFGPSSRVSSLMMVLYINANLFSIYHYIFWDITVLLETFVTLDFEFLCLISILTELDKKQISSRIFVEDHSYFYSCLFITPTGMGLTFIEHLIWLWMGSLEGTALQFLISHDNLMSRKYLPHFIEVEMELQGLEAACSVTPGEKALISGKIKVLNF